MYSGYFDGMTVGLLEFPLEIMQKDIGWKESVLPHFFPVEAATVTSETKDILC
jgi:hypothetical protein